MNDVFEMIGNPFLNRFFVLFIILNFEGDTPKFFLKNREKTNGSSNPTEFPIVPTDISLLNSIFLAIFSL